MAKELIFTEMNLDMLGLGEMVKDMVEELLSMQMEEQKQHITDLIFTNMNSYISTNNAGNILQKLYDAVKVGRKMAIEIINGGNTPFLYSGIK